MQAYVYPSMQMTLTEEDIKNWIANMVPGISYKDYWKIRNEFIYEHFPLEVCIARYLRNKQVEAWEKSKNKHYYKVRMNNNGYKYVYMCEEMVNDFYPNKHWVV